MQKYSNVILKIWYRLSDSVKFEITIKTLLMWINPEPKGQIASLQELITNLMEALCFLHWIKQHTAFEFMACTMHEAHQAVAKWHLLKDICRNVLFIGLTCSNGRNSVIMLRFLQRVIIHHASPLLLHRSSPSCQPFASWFGVITWIFNGNDTIK